MTQSRLLKSFFLSFMLLAPSVLLADEITLSHRGITLNANLEKADNWPNGKVILMTHGTLAHNKMEIMETLQGLFNDQGISSLAINLSLGLDNRKGFYDCAAPHNHKHTDAMDEIGSWIKWLEQQGVKQVVLLGHSRGGNQTAWFAAEQDNPLIKNIVLIAPQIWSMEYAKENYQKRYAKDLTSLLSKAGSLIQSGKGSTQLKNIDFIYCKDTTVAADAFVSYYSDSPNMDTPYLMPKIKKPLMVFAGTNDEAVKNLDKIVAPLAEKHDFKLNVMDGADHSFRDLYADEIVETIVEFIAE